jgi:O-antigen/teichoic acid export membrane protein
MAVLKNIAANYAGVAVAAISPILAVPLYLSALGTSRWGLVSFATTLASLFSLLEVGLSQRLVRDLTIARQQEPARAAAAFRGIEICYWALGRLDADTLSDGSATVYFAAVLTITQIPNSAYRSALLSSDHHLTLNVQVALFSICKHVAGVIVVMTWKNLTYVYVSYALTASAELAVRAWTARRAIAVSHTDSKVDWNTARGMLSAGAKLSIAVVAGLLTQQSDRLFLSRFATIHDLGIYGIATALAYGPLQLTYPLLISVTPALAAVVADPARLHVLCIRLLQVVLIALAAAVFSYFMIGEWVVRLWLRNDTAFMEVRPVLRLLLVGTALNVVYQVSYQRWLVMGNTRQILAVNAISLVLAVTAAPALIAAWGTIGAAGGWIAINAVGVLFNLRWMCGYG